MLIRKLFYVLVYLELLRLRPSYLAGWIRRCIFSTAKLWGLSDSIYCIFGRVCIDRCIVWVWLDIELFHWDRRWLRIQYFNFAVEFLGLVTQRKWRWSYVDGVRPDGACMFHLILELPKLIHQRILLDSWSQRGLTELIVLLYITYPHITDIFGQQVRILARRGLHHQLTLVFSDHLLYPSVFVYSRRLIVSKSDVLERVRRISSLWWGHVFHS